MNRALIIAEAGVNHNGRIDLAYRLIDAAKQAGADFVKFQTFKADELVKKNAQKAEYQKTGKDETQYELLKKLELTDKAHLELYNYCELTGIKFLSTPFSSNSINLLNDLVPFFKVSSSDFTNLLFIEELLHTKKPIILSTGMADIGEVKRVCDFIKSLKIDTVNRVEIGNGISLPAVTLLHCSTSYPTPLQDVNLNAMNKIKEVTGFEVGYSDHTLGINVSLASVAMGAKVIEKHFTLDRNSEGPDHKASLEPSELKALVQGIREIEISLGSYEKKPSAIELQNKFVARKGVYAARDLSIGEILKKEDLSIMRPLASIDALDVFQILGKKAKAQFNKGEPITFAKLEND